MGRLLLLAVVIALVVWLLRGRLRGSRSSAPAAGRAPDTVALPRDRRVLLQARVMLDGTYAWVSNASGGITQINQSTYQIVKTITWTTSATLPGGTAGMAQEGNHLWVALPSCCQFSNGSIIELDKTTGTIIRSVQVGRYPSSIAIDANSVWVANGGDDTLSQVDIATGTLVKTFYPASPSYITFSIRSRIGILADDGSHVWLLGEQGKIAMLNASDGSLVKIFDATYGGKSEYFLSSVTTDSKYVWVCGMETVFQIDKSTGTIVGAVTVPNPAYSMASDNSSVWLGTDPYFSQIGID